MTTETAVDKVQNDVPKTVDAIGLQEILHHLLRKSPVQEAEQQIWHQKVNELTLTAEEKEAVRQSEQQQAGNAPPGWLRNADGSWTQIENGVPANS